MPQIANELKQKFGNLPGMKTCADSAPNGTDFTRAMFQGGAVPKAINASFLDMDYKIYDNPLFSNNTFQVRRAMLPCWKMRPLKQPQHAFRH